MTEKQKIQFEMLKKGEIFIWNIEDLTDEMKWWGCQNNCTMNSISLTEEMLIYMIRNANVRFNEKQLVDVSIPEDAWIEGIQKTTEHDKYFNKFLKLVFEYSPITSNIACEMCMVVPYYYKEEKIYNSISHADDSEKLKEKIKKSVFQLMDNEPQKMYYQCIYPDFCLTDNDWRQIMYNGHLSSNSVEYFIKTRTDIPLFIKQYLLSLWDTGPYVYLKHFGEMSAEDLIFWCNNHKIYFDKNTLHNNNRLCSFLDGVKCKDMTKVLEQHGWLIKYIKTSSKKFQKAAIKCNPENIQYIKNPSDEIAIYALSLDKNVLRFLKKTKAICEYLNINSADLFPATHYLVKLDACVCDESSIIKICVIEGKDMENFLKKSFTVAFGNLSDNEELFVQDVATYYPLTNEELSIIRKFNLDNIQSGWFSDL